MFCPKCGAQLPDNAAFCNSCGNKLAAAPKPAAPAPTPAPVAVPSKFTKPAKAVKPAKAPKPAAPRPAGKAGLPKNVIMGAAAVLVIAVLGFFISGLFGGNTVYVMQSENSDYSYTQESYSLEKGNYTYDGVKSDSTSYTYDDHGNVLTATHNESSESVTWSFSGYDEYGTPSSATNGSYTYNVETTSRDKEGRPMAIAITRNGKTFGSVTYERNPDGTTKVCTISGQMNMRFELDNKGRLTVLNAGSSSAVADHSKGTLTDSGTSEQAIYKLDSHGYATEITTPAQPGAKTTIAYTYSGNCPTELSLTYSQPIANFYGPGSGLNSVTSKCTWAKISKPSPAALARFNLEADLGKYLLEYVPTHFTYDKAMNLCLLECLIPF